jgi:lysophospholipase L1-like esterase
MTVLKRVARLVATLIKWLLIVAVCTELCSFLIVTISNYIVYGQVREGTRAVYDPYALFLQSPSPRPTVGNSISQQPAMNRTIWMFGGSTMRGATDYDARTIPSFVSSYLNAHGNGLHFNVLNFGIDSFNSLLESKYLEKALIERKSLPNVIVFYDGANDVAYFAQYRTPYGHYGYRRMRGLIDSYYSNWFGLFKVVNVAIYASFTRELYDKLHEALLPVNPTSPELRKMADMTAARYDFINKLANAFGMKFLLVWQPTRWTEDCAVNPAVAAGESRFGITTNNFKAMRSNFRTTYSALAGHLSGKPYFENFATVLCSRVVPSYKVDGVHLNANGRRAVADAMGRMLIQRFFSQ